MANTTRTLLSAIIDACEIISKADTRLGNEWADRTRSGPLDYWDFDSDGKQRPASAMDELAEEMLAEFPSRLTPEDKETLSETLRELFNAVDFLGYFASSQ
jgi:hypothetical protein